MKSAIRCAYIALVGLTVFIGALCIAQGMRTREEKPASPKTEMRVPPDGPRTTL